MKNQDLMDLLMMLSELEEKIKNDMESDDALDKLEEIRLKLVSL
jgi:hypothetical protein